MNRVVEISWPPSVSGTSYTLTKEYDGNGNITKVTDFKSDATSYTY